MHGRKEKKGGKKIRHIKKVIKKASDEDS